MAKRINCNDITAQPQQQRKLIQALSRARQKFITTVIGSKLAAHQKQQ